MASNYEKLFSLTTNQSKEGSPVIISAGALLKHKEIGILVAQLKFHSVSNKCITALKVLLKCYTPLKEEADRIEYMYMDLNINRDDDFGSKVPIAIKDKTVRSFDVIVSKVLFSDGTIWENDMPFDECLGDKQDLKSISADNYFLESIKSQYGSLAEFIPKDYGLYWSCVCGAINTKEEKTCHKCGIGFKRIIDVDFYKFEEVCRKDKIYGIASSLEQNAKTKDDYLQAMKHYVQIEDWKDSKKRIESCQIRIKEFEQKELVEQEEAIKAEAIKKEKPYNEAIIAEQEAKTKEELLQVIDYYKRLNGWKDSNERIEVCRKRIEEIDQREIEEQRAREVRRQELLEKEKEERKKALYEAPHNSKMDIKKSAFVLGIVSCLCLIIWIILSVKFGVSLSFGEQDVNGMRFIPTSLLYAIPLVCMALCGFLRNKYFALVFPIFIIVFLVINMVGSAIEIGSCFLRDFMLLFIWIIMLVAVLLWFLPKGTTWASRFLWICAPVFYIIYWLMDLWNLTDLADANAIDFQLVRFVLWPELLEIVIITVLGICIMKDGKNKKQLKE